MGTIDFDQKLREWQREYLDFLDDEEDQAVYYGKVKSMIEDKQVRIVININDLRRKNPERTKGLIQNSFEEHLAFEKALKEYITSVDATYALENDYFFISFEGSFGNKHVTPRTITSKLLGGMVCMEGIVTKASQVLTKVVRSVHYCPATGRVLERLYTDLTSYDAFPSSSVYPTKDEDGNILETEYGLSVYKNHQTVTVQEMPEKSPPGQLPRSIDIICDNDLADKCKPGDRIQIVGHYRCLPGKKGNFTSGTFRTIIIANHLTHLNDDILFGLTRNDVMICRKLSKKRNIFDMLSKSIAPSIHGNDYVKKAILCMLLGGVEKILPNGTRLRGDINVLLIGDPSVAKSQLLRYVIHSAPRAIPTTGRGSSGVGLTAAVTTDQESGERRLEAGAMVLGDRGVVCIDEFDKMSDIDRTAIHEVMEQGRVTICKAGIHARLNARCSVLAAANPVYGKYDQYKAPADNIGLQDSLLSRFDLLFVMMDIVDPEVDEKIADHVVRMHRYRMPGQQDGEVLPIETSADMLTTYNTDENKSDDEKLLIFEKYNPLLHGSSRSSRDKIFTVQFLKKYIHVAKVLKPVLTVESSNMIAEEYAKLRSEDMMESDTARTQPVTVRTLETLIRLSTAHAKARLSPTVQPVDAEAAIELVQFAYFKKVLEKPKRKRKRNDDASDNEADGENEDDEHDDDENASRSSSKRSRTVFDFDESEEMDTQPDSEPVTRASVQESLSETPTVYTLPEPTSVTAERLKVFKSHVVNIFREKRCQTCSLQILVQYVNDHTPDAQFDGGEVAAAVQIMTDANQIMLSDGIVFLI